MKLMASSAHRWYNCPGSLKLEETLPAEFKVSFYDDKKNAGKIAHAVSERVLNDFIAGKKPKSFNAFMKEFNVPLKSDDYYKIKNASEYYVKKIKKDYNALKKYGKTELIIEVKNRVRPEKDVECVAQADAIIITEKKDGSHLINIYDLKSGNYDYTTSATKQLDFTSMFIPHIFPEFKHGMISLCIVQPNFWDDSYKFVSEIRLSDIERLKIDFKNLIREARQDIIEPCDGCNFCPCVSICPAMMDVTKSIIVKSGTMDVEKDFDKYKKFFEFVYSQKKNMETFLKNIEAVILADLQKGGVYDSIMLGEGSGHRKWADELTVKERLSFLGDELFDIKLKSPSQIEKIAGKENIKDLTTTPKFIKIVPRKSDFGSIIE